jgi:hypothetical protein
MKAGKDDQTVKPSRVKIAGLSNVALSTLVGASAATKSHLLGTLDDFWL